MGIFIIGLAALLNLILTSVFGNLKKGTFILLTCLIVVILGVSEAIIPGKYIGKELVSKVQLYKNPVPFVYRKQFYIINQPYRSTVSGQSGVYYIKEISKDSYSYIYKIDSQEMIAYKEGIVTGHVIPVYEHKDRKINLPMPDPVKLYGDIMIPVHDTIIGSLVYIIEYEDIEAEQPMLYIYRRAYEPNFWTFFPSNNKYEYVFRIPSGTIFKNPELDE